MKHLIPTLALFAILLLTACKTTKPVVVPERHDSIAIRTEFIHDSIYIDNWHTIYRNGDTIYRTDSIVHIEYKFISRGDTLRIHDSIPVITEVQVPVRQPNGWDKFATWFTIIILILIAAYIVIRVLKAVYLRK